MRGMAAFLSASSGNLATRPLPAFAASDLPAIGRGNPEHRCRSGVPAGMPGIGQTMPSMPVLGEGASLAGPGPSRLRRPEPAGAVSAHPGYGPSRFRPPGGETAPVLDPSSNLSHAASPEGDSPAPARQRLRPPGADVAALVSCRVPSQAATDMSSSLTTGLPVSARTRSTPPH